MIVCSKCGTEIKIPIIRPSAEYICNSCYIPLPSFCGNSVSDGHYNDDCSGGSGSWDTAIKLCEGMGL